MIGKRFSKRWIFTWLLWLALFIPTFAFFYGRHEAREEKHREMKIQYESLRDEKEARAEAERRNAEKTALAPTPENETEPQPGVGMTLEVKDGVEVVTSGPLKGMTLEEAKEAEYKRRAETLEAAKKRRQWERRRDALKKRDIENSRKVRASARATLASADAELDAMLSLYALMTPEQLEYVREEALKNMPAEKVEAFFDALANHRTTKTPEQLTKDAQDILKSREAHKIARREIEIESQQIALEYEELKRTEPPIPW